jgi:hypothetical protein
MRKLRSFKCKQINEHAAGSSIVVIVVDDGDGDGSW